MTWQTDLLALIEGDAGVVAAVGRPNFAAWGWSPEFDPLPRVVLSLVSQQPDHHELGPSRLLRARVQVDVFATTYAKAAEIATAIRQSLDGYTGVPFESIFVEIEVDGVEPSADLIPRRRLDLSVAVNS